MCATLDVLLVQHLMCDSLQIHSVAYLFYCNVASFFFTSKQYFFTLVNVWLVEQYEYLNHLSEYVCDVISTWNDSNPIEKMLSPFKRNSFSGYASCD